LIDLLRKRDTSVTNWDTVTNWDIYLMRFEVKYKKLKQYAKVITSRQNPLVLKHQLKLTH